MGRFASYDGTLLAYHEKGSGPPLICVPGGPMRASAYLGDLGGLSTHRRLVLLDHRGTGSSDVPTDPATYRCDRLVEDVEALRQHLDLDRIDLLGHSAAGSVVTLYAARHPDRVARSVLVAPSWMATGLEFPDDEWLAALRLREHEPWFADAFAAMLRLDEGDRSPATRLAAYPLFVGEQNDAARATAESEPDQVNAEARDAFRAPGAFGDPARTRAALATLPAPVLLVGGEYDPAPTPRLLRDFAALFAEASVVIQPGAGHLPWLDDADRFVGTVAGFLASVGGSRAVASGA
jgi:proline iminopeptidase